MGNLPPLRDLTQLLRPSGVAQRLRPGPLADRLLPNAVAGWLRSGSGPSKDDEKVERPREADLPDAVVQANGLPIQRATVVAVPVEIAYNQFTQFEDFPDFMRAIAKAEQIDAAQVEFELRRWGLRRRWRAQIVDQRPEERIAWRSVSGMRLVGVTTFHSIADRLTRIDASVVVEPAGGLQRIARRLRLVDRVIAGELRRFKAFIEMREEETGAWRGYIADGEVVAEDDYFGWESGEENREDAPAEDLGGSGADARGGPSADASRARQSRDADAPDGEARSDGTAAKGSRAGSRSSGAGKSTSGRASPSNGASAKVSGTTGTSAGKSGSGSGGRTRASK